MFKMLYELNFLFFNLLRINSLKAYFLDVENVKWNFFFSTKSLRFSHEQMKSEFVYGNNCINADFLKGTIILINERLSEFKVWLP